ncbi:nose resistant to fluoxetine protein 6 isoform X2 [Fopius arisanus]|uniref:Nose resistant to fluoxetine protein 6 isoform X2 n=1 Tax=Fopius arisanus TaxID=64838 RepID=A0A9R1T838_9HYME|nr:PREDICTED: nose resistant to fluoxetine protein 6-like isoform X2 [Fopius arisanus]
MVISRILVWILWCGLPVILGVKTVNILSTSGVKSIEEEDILRVLAQNTSDSSENLTFVDLVESWRNHTGTSSDFLWNPESTDKYKYQVDNEVDQLFSIAPVFDPAAGVVSPECRKHSEIYNRELRKMSLWALKMFDATAKIPSGLLSGNINQLGDFDECLGLEGPEDIRGQYCLAYLQLEIDHHRDDLKEIHRLVHSHYAFRSNITDPGHRVPRFSTVQWAVCTPSSCTSQDVESSLRATISKYTSHTGLNITVKVDREMCQVQRTEPLPTETLIVGGFFISVIGLATVAAVCDHLGADVSEIVLAFSLKRNLRKLLSMKPGDDDIATLHGIRAINALMLIVAHKSMALFFNPYVNRTGMAEYLGRPWTVIGRAASLYTDPFIMLSGLLTTYSFVGRLRKSGEIHVKKEYLSRLFRLVPNLGALILFCMFIMPYIGSGPQWNLVVTHHADICKKTWWRNFLFIHNYFGFENMCLTHTHHIGIDTQLFALSPIMVLTLYKYPKLGGLILTFMALLSTGLRYYVTYFKRLNNYVFFGTSIRQLFDTANLSYILPTHRLTVYIIGIFVGYFLRICPKGYKMSKSVIRLGWTLTSMMALGAFFGPAGMGSINYVYNPIHAATYNAFAPIGWCAFFAWIAFISHTKNTSGWVSEIFAWRGFLVCTRLSYAIYLTQFPVFFFNVGKTRSAEHYEFFRMLFNFHELGWIIVMSAVLTLLFDSPFQNLKRYLLRKPSTQQKIVKAE